MAGVKVTINIPNGFKYEKKEQIAVRIVDFIKLRTLSGFDKDNRRFSSYTEEYAEKKGTGRRDVDLQLTGEMLDAMKIFKIGRNYIEIGYDGRSNQALKAEGNILGTYGQPLPIPGKARDFLGLTQKDLDAIIQEFSKDEDEVAAEFFENNMERINRELSQAQIDRFRRQQLLESLGLSDAPTI